MDDILLSYYNRELNYIRKMGAEFSERYPKVAGRLRLDGETVEDPHVSRLIESFAFLTARIQHSLDDNFPELTEALMGILYPDYHAPIPSMGIVQFLSLPQINQSLNVPKQHLIRMETNAGDYCYYQTCSCSEILPIDIYAAKIYSLPVKAPPLPEKIQAEQSVQSVLRLSIKPLDEEKGFDLDADNLRFYINAQPDIAFRLREYMLDKVVGITVAEHSHDDNPIFLPKEAIGTYGFSEDEALLDYDGRTSSAHRLLAEYFLLPQKFLFVELNQLGQTWKKYPKGFEIYMYFDQSHIDISRSVNKNVFALGCVPVVNLFDTSCEPIKSATFSAETQLKVSDQYTNIADVYRVNRVYAINAQGERKDLLPFYSSHIDHSNNDVSWTIRRENSLWQKGISSRGTDTYLSLVDKEFTVSSPKSDWLINAEVTCTNRDLPNQLPFGPDKPNIEFLDGIAGLRIRCLTPPTSTVLPELANASRWQLASQLSLQHLSGKSGLSRLKEVLQLYSFSQTKEVKSLIDGIVDLHSEITTTRILDRGRSAMCQGTHFIMTCDESFYTGNSLYVFGEVMDEFLSQFCAINSFTQLSIRSTKHYTMQYEWLPRVGCQPLI
ncbi:MAG: type VI secretion system baseplate subunit TssF [Cellvibrionaceae bacterium]|nr:type VI secretion system baseplate subunit TssF [Cellvibrionaceae bacterium]